MFHVSGCPFMHSSMRHEQYTAYLLRGARPKSAVVLHIIAASLDCVVQGNTKAKECREAAAAAAAAAEMEAQLDADADIPQPLHRRLLGALAV